LLTVVGDVSGFGKRATGLSLDDDIVKARDGLNQMHSRNKFGNRIVKRFVHSAKTPPRQGHGQPTTCRAVPYGRRSYAYAGKLVSNNISESL
jgi:hypothetical protein